MPYNPSCAAASPYCSAGTRITKGYCDAHYYRDSKYGSPYGGRAAPGERLDFLERAVLYQGSDCLLWPYAVFDPKHDGETGYGRLLVDGKIVAAHREVLRRAKGEPPQPGMHATHDPAVCTSRLCVNPAHIRWVAQDDTEAERLTPVAAARKGESSPTAQLSREQVRAIFVDARPYAVIAAEYGIHPVYVGKIKRRERRAEDTADLEPVRGHRSGDRHPKRAGKGGEGN